MRPPDPVTAAESPQALSALNQWLAAMPAQERIAWAFESLAGPHALSTSFGVQSAVSLHLLTQAKPDGLLVVPVDQVVAFLHPLPVAALWGVGERTEERLVSLGLRTVGDIAHTPVDTLVRALGQASGQRLYDLSWGRDDRHVVPDSVEKSIGNEETFARDVDDPEIIAREILRLAQKVAARARRQGMRGRTVVLKIRFADFTTITRSRTLDDPTDVGQVIYDTAADLYAALRLHRARVRLVGVRLEGLVDLESAAEQLLLDDGSTASPLERRAAEVAADRLRDRFGHDVVRPARLWTED